MVIKNIFKQLLVVLLSVGVVMPAHADWRSSFSNAAVWVSNKSASAVSAMNGWLFKAGTQMPDSSAIITDISEPMPMAYVAPVATAVVAENSSAPISIALDMPALQELAHTPEIAHTVWDTVCEYKKPIIGTLAVGGLGAFAWYKYKKYNDTKRKIKNDNLQILVDLPAIDQVYQQISEQGQMILPLYKKIQANAKQLTTKAHAVGWQILEKIYKVLDNSKENEEMHKQVESMKDQLFESQRQELAAKMIAGGAALALEDAVINYGQLAQDIALEKERDLLIDQDHAEKLTTLEQDIKQQQEKARASQQESQRVGKEVDEILSHRFDKQNPELQQEYARIAEKRKEREERMNKTLKKYNKNEPKDLVWAYNQALEKQLEDSKQSVASQQSNLSNSYRLASCMFFLETNALRKKIAELENQLKQNDSGQALHKISRCVPKETIDSFSEKVAEIAQANTDILKSEIEEGFTWEQLFELLLCETNSSKMRKVIADKKLVRRTCARLIQIATASNSITPQVQLASIAHEMITQIVTMYDQKDSQ